MTPTQTNEDFVYIPQVKRRPKITGVVKHTRLVCFTKTSATRQTESVQIKQDRPSNYRVSGKKIVERIKTTESIDSAEHRPTTQKWSPPSTPIPTHPPTPPGHSFSSHLSFNHKGRWGTDTSFLHFSLFSTALWDLAISRPVHSLMLSFHLFLCWPCPLPPFSVPCKMVLARPDKRET